MSIKKIALAIVGGVLVSNNVLAISLIEVYKQAYTNDPKFRAAYAQWLVDKETLPINRSAILPQMSASGTLGRSHNNGEDTFTQTGSLISNNGFYNSAQYSLTLTQSLFDFGQWSKIWQAQAIVKKAEVDMLAAKEDLLLRTATAYFDVLEAYDMLSFAKANREFLEKTLNQVKRQYEVGIIAVVELENAKAGYDGSIADEIKANNNVSICLEKLCEITGVRYLSLDPVKKDFPLLSPQPANIEKWVAAAEQQNFILAGFKYNSIAYKEAIKIANAGHLPTATAGGTYNYNYNGNYLPGITTDRTKSATASVQMSLPLFQGGQVISQARQANYAYQKAISDQETNHRAVVSNTRQQYLNVLSYISQIKANRQAVISAEASVSATKAGYEAGTQTMVDVLNMQKNFFENQKDYAISEYSYIKSFLTLKQLTGILNETDIAKINTWLEKQKMEEISGTRKIIVNKNNKPKKIKKIKPARLA